MNTDQEMMRSGLNLIQQALSIYDSDLRLTVSNRRFQELFNLPDEMVAPNAPFAETIRHLVLNGEYGDVGDVDIYVLSRIEQALAFKPHYVERQRSNGRWIAIEGSPLSQGGWVTVYTDITEIKQQEALLSSHSEKLSSQLLRRSEQLTQSNRELAATVSALEEAKRQLTESEARTRMTSEMTPAHIAHVGRDQIYTYSNRRLREVISDRPIDIVGLSAEQALGTEAYGKVKPYLEQAFEGAPSVFEFDLDNGTRRVRVAFTPDNGPEGSVVGAYVLSMDITQEAQARAILMQTRKRELAAQLASGLAHDFSNLLTIILGLQGQIERIPGIPLKALEAIATTKAAALRGGALLDRLSDVSGRRELVTSTVQIDGLLEDVRALATATLPAGIMLELRNEGVTDPVILDHGFLQDALINMILNARDAIETTGIITLVARVQGGTWLEFQVSDTGQGFSKEALECALDPFFTTKASEGSGLGLTMIYDFAQLSGGRLHIENTAKGAQVTVRLPLRFSGAKGAPGLVLLVEDDPQIRAAVRAMLRDIGHTVLEADTPGEALTLARLPGITHVLSDIMLGDATTGIEMILQMQKNGLEVPVTMMTGLPKSAPQRRAAEARFKVLSKPFSSAQLNAIFEAITP